MEKKKRNPVARLLVTDDRYANHFINRTKADRIKQELEEEAEEQLKEYLNGTEESRQEPV